MQTFLIIYCKQLPRVVLSIILVCFFFACKNGHKPPDNDLVKKPEQLEDRMRKNLKKLLSYAEGNESRINDSVALMSFELTNAVYKKNNHQAIWSTEGEWQAIADSLFNVVEHAKEYGLFPSDYNAASLIDIRATIQTDSVSRRNAALWSRADVLLTDAYLNLAKHLKLGRLDRDSLTLRNDSLINDAYFLQYFQEAITNKNIRQSLLDLEPRYLGYKMIRKGIRKFLDSADFSAYTYLTYSNKDSLPFIKALITRLSEGGFISKEIQPTDTSYLPIAIRNYQQSKNIKPTGRISESLIRSLNYTDKERFKSIAISLDRYKLLADSVPKTFIMVNLASFTLQVYTRDSIVLQSKVIVGTPKTKTPLLNSQVSNFITYPQWTVPYSIIFKEILPKIQVDIHYLEKENLMVVDKNDSVLDPFTIVWSKLNKNYFPYLIRQREGDDNSLGVIKFNFANKYDVYLHDTNARWLFSKSARALSHGCVRVQDWEKLAHYLVRADTVRFSPDTLRAWIGRQEKHTITGFPRMPLLIRYFTVQGQEGRLQFYDDIYGYDKAVKEKYFAKKTIE